MKDLVKAMDNLPKIVKLILCIPCIAIVWAIYRVVRSLVAGNTLAAVTAVVLIFVGIPFLWLIDLICILLGNKVWWIC
jgi:hypothetical protein